MDKGRDMSKKVILSDKKVGISKNNHLGIKLNAPRKISYISRSKNMCIPLNNKKCIYSDSKSSLQQLCDIGSSMKPQIANVEHSHDLNGNLSFIQYPAFSFPSVPEIPNFGLSYQTQHNFNISVQNPSKHRKSGCHQKQDFNSKAPISKLPFHTNKLFSAIPHSNISYHSSKNNHGPLSKSIPFVKFPTSIREGALVTDNRSIFVASQIIGDPYNVKLDDKFFAPDKTCFTLQLDSEAQLCNLKSDHFVHNWQQISISSLFENPADVKDADKMLFSSLNTSMLNVPVKTNFECTIPSTTKTNVMCVIPPVQMSMNSHKLSDYKMKKQELQNMPHVNLKKPSFYKKSIFLSPALSEKSNSSLENVDEMSLSSFPSETDVSVFSANSSINVGNKDQITFGIEYDEMIKLCSDDCDPDLNLVRTKLLLKKLYWQESDVKYSEDNHVELTTYFASLWKECDRKTDSEPSRTQKVKIYQEP